jgi:hypothetical protein
MAGALTAAIAAAFAGGVTADPYFEYTTLLLPGSGTNGAQNNTFLDGSTNNFTITRNGNTTQGTFSPFSQTGWGNYFDGTGDYLTVPSNAAFSFGTSDYSMEFWMYCTSYGSASQNILDCRGSAGSSNGPVIYLENGSGTGTKQLRFSDTVNTEIATASNFPINNWTHVVATRSGTTTRLFTNGTLVGTSTSSVNVSNTGGVFIGAYAGGLALYIGYLSNVRIVKGSIPTLYQTSSTTPGASIFTPPTSPLTAISGTSLLTCQSNRFIDNSTNNFTITVNGDTRVVAFSPFNPTASWSAATYGGSGYFDGSGDTLFTTNTAIASGSTAFTVEAWVYPTSLSGTSTLYGGVSNIIEIQYSSGGISYNKAGVAGVLSSATAPTLNAWNHIVVVRNTSNNSSLFLNGVRLATTASDSNTFSATTTYIGGSASSAFVFCYISNFRYVNGTAVYNPTQTTLTVPTAPLTNITNTSLLLNFTNAGIYDATSKNDLETVGNAQISTTQSKWGGSSISFDGTGDWLLIPDQPPQRIGTGKFTIELWVYRNSSGTYGLVGKGTGTTGWLVSLNSSNQVVFTYASSTITSTGTVSATTWTHIAVVREGTSTNQTKIYINGTNDGTGTVSTDFNQTNSMYIGADRTGGSAANAYVQDVRITNDARYTANFTAPTAAFPTL